MSPTIGISHLCEWGRTGTICLGQYLLWCLTYYDDFCVPSETFGRSTAASQYFLQLAGYLGIPVIAWNADNSGLERRVSCATLVLRFLIYDFDEIYD